MAIAVAREKRNEKKNEQKKSHAETRKAIQQSMHCIEWIKWMANQATALEELQRVGHISVT